MITEETFYRPREIDRESRHIPARTYNLAYLLLKRSGLDCLFVPIRSMQYLAVVDPDEIVFVHSERRRMIDISWQDFGRHTRSSLTDPVSYVAVYFSPDSREIMKRLQGEFLKALLQLDSRREIAQGAVVVKVGPGAN